MRCQSASVIQPQNLHAVTVSKTPAPTCEEDITGCDAADLCDAATYGLIGAKDWKRGSFIKFVDEAKRRGLRCDVIAKPQDENTDSNTAPSIASVTVSKTPAPTCEEDITGCDAADLCDAATYGLIGAKDWKRGSFIKFVDEAKRRGLRCDVITKPQEEKTDSNTSPSIASVTVSKTPAPTCEEDITGCDAADLCDAATYGLIGAKDWKRGSFIKFVDEAKRRGLSCGVLDLEQILSLQS